MYVDPSREMTPQQRALLSWHTTMDIGQKFVTNGYMAAASARALRALIPALSAPVRELVEGTLEFYQGMLRGMGYLFAAAITGEREGEHVERLTDDINERIDELDQGSGLRTTVGLAVIRFKELSRGVAPYDVTEPENDSIAKCVARAILEFAPDERTIEELILPLGNTSGYEKDRTALREILQADGGERAAFALRCLSLLEDL